MNMIPGNRYTKVNIIPKPNELIMEFSKGG